MAERFVFDFQIKVGVPLKKKELDEMTAIMDRYMKTRGDYRIDLKEHSYKDFRSTEEGLILFLVMSGVADFVTILMALRELLKKKSKIKEVRIKSDNKEITITGDISDEAIVEIVKEGKNV